MLVANKNSEMLKAAMRYMVSSVAVISTVDHNGMRHAMTATSATPVCMDPPAMLFCVFKNSTFHKALQAENRFCINVLAKENIPVAQLCSSKAVGEERFTDGEWRSWGGTPYLNNAQSCIICETDKVISYGTHDIFIGVVQEVFLRDELEPLLYVDRGYRTLFNEKQKVGI